jgi:hypothetical protein
MGEVHCCVAFYTQLTMVLTAQQLHQTTSRIHGHNSKPCKILSSLQSHSHHLVLATGQQRQQQMGWQPLLQECPGWFVLACVPMLSQTIENTLESLGCLYLRGRVLRAFAHSLYCPDIDKGRYLLVQQLLLDCVSTGLLGFF